MIKATKKTAKKKVNQKIKLRNPHISKDFEKKIVEFAISNADSGFGQNEHPIRSAEQSAEGTIDYLLKYHGDKKYTEKDLKDARDLYMDIFMYRYFGILNNPKIRKLHDLYGG